MSQEDISLSEQEEIRREKLTQLNELGVNPYPYSFEVTHYSKNIKADETLLRDLELNTDSESVSIAGRVMTRRIMGKAAFFNLQDSEGTIQVYIRRDDVGIEAYNTVFKKMVDIGDIVGIKGFVFKTRTGETTVHAEEFEFLTKTLRPYPHPKRSRE